MSLPHRLIQILTLRCEAASGLTSQRLDERLPLPERLALRGHLLTCGACRRLDRQLRILRDANRLRVAGDPAAPDDDLSPEARARIAHAIGAASPEAGNNSNGSNSIE